MDNVSIQLHVGQEVFLKPGVEKKWFSLRAGGLYTVARLDASDGQMLWLKPSDSDDLYPANPLWILQGDGLKK